MCCPGMPNAFQDQRDRIWLRWVIFRVGSTRTHCGSRCVDEIVWGGTSECEEHDWGFNHPEQELNRSPGQSKGVGYDGLGEWPVASPAESQQLAMRMDSMLL